MSWDKQYEAGTTGCGNQNGTNGGCSNICIPHPHPNATVSTNRVCLCSEESKPHTPYHGEVEQCHCHSSSENFNQITGACERKSKLDSSYVHSRVEYT